MIGIPFTNQQIKTLHQSNYIQSEEKIHLIFDKLKSMLGSILFERLFYVQIVRIQRFCIDKNMLALFAMMHTTHLSIIFNNVHINK